MEEKERIAFIVNPVSGTGKQKNIVSQIEEHLDHNKYSPTVLYTTHAHHAEKMAQEVIDEGIPNLVAVGGDGSINDCVQSIVGSDVNLGIIPLGSGNGLARHLKIPLKIKDAIQVINEQKTTVIDTVSINDRIYASIAGIGFDAQVAKEFAFSQIRGFQTYFRIIFRTYPFYEPVNYRLEVDGSKKESKALFISFANSNQFGYNTEVAPKAQLDDGLLDICIVKKVPLPMVFWTAQLLLTKQFEKSMYVQTIQARDVKIHNNQGGWVNVDGEPVKLGEHLHLKVLPHTLRVIVP